MMDSAIWYGGMAVVFALGMLAGGRLAHRLRQERIRLSGPDIRSTYTSAPKARDGHCPTCGQRVRVGGSGCTHYYIGVDAEALARLQRSIVTRGATD